MKKAFLMLLFLPFFSLGQGENWNNPADRYLEEYKKYENAPCPIPDDNIKHFVYFSRDRQSVADHSFLKHPKFSGAQIMYTWKELEPEKGNYDFSKIEQDIKYLDGYGKKLFIQLQDVTFYPQYKAVPDYLLSAEYDGGVVQQFNDAGKSEGWVAKRWNKKLGERFALFLIELGKAVDGKIEGINLQETAVEISAKNDASFSEEKYFNALKANMLALKKAFPISISMIYANFIPGEWLPWEDKGYLKGIYDYGNEIGVGLGTPDLMVTRKGQLNNPLAMMHENDFEVPLGIAIQDGNYVGKTGADSDYNEHSGNGNTARNSKVPMLHAFAKGFLKVDYMFWVNQVPYFEEDVLPCFSDKSK